MTKRAKTLPLKPVPFSPAGAKLTLAAGAGTVLSKDAVPPDDAIEAEIESA
jgi:hypothetical protein